MASMLTTIWLIISAFAFGGVAEKTGVLERLILPIVAAARTTGRLIASVVVAVLGAGIATADQYLSIVLPGRMFKPSFAARGLGPTVLSRSVGASGTPTSALIPWNSCGAYLAATLGVATLSYAPYAIFGMASPLLTIAAGYLGFRVLRASPAPVDETGRIEGGAAGKS
jgi:NhaC family Na+:H+ antiporter